MFSHVPAAHAPDDGPPALKAEAKSINKAIAELEKQRASVRAAQARVHREYDRCPAECDRVEYFEQLSAAYVTEVAIRRRLPPIWQALGLLRSREYQDVRRQLDDIETKVRNKLGWPEDKPVPVLILQSQPRWQTLHDRLRGMPSDVDAALLQNNSGDLLKAKAESERYAALARHETGRMGQVNRQRAIDEKKRQNQTAAREREAADRAAAVDRLLEPK